LHQGPVDGPVHFSVHEEFASRRALSIPACDRPLACEAFNGSMRERPQPQLFLRDLPDPREAVRLDDQEEDDQAAEDHQLDVRRDAAGDAKMQRVVQKVGGCGRMILCTPRSAGSCANCLAISMALSSPPYSCSVVKLGDDDIEQGRQENSATLRELAERKKANNWVETWHDRIVEVSLPRWAKR